MQVYPVPPAVSPVVESVSLLAGASQATTVPVSGGSTQAPLPTSQVATLCTSVVDPDLELCVK